MSFHVQFVARSKKHALEQLEKQSSLPSSVAAFLLASIVNLSPAREGYQRIITVKASGHLCEGDSYSVSTATIEVNPIEIPD